MRTRRQQQQQQQQQQTKPLINTLITIDLIWSATLLLLVSIVFVPIKASIRPNCRCIQFDDTFGKEYGVFHSPDWPTPYEDNIDCLLYTFIAPLNHIVEITFDEFDIQRNEQIGCDYGDYVKLFLHLSTPNGGVHERTQWNSVLCGKFPDIEQTHYSSNRTLIFEFHSDWRPGNNTGFRGTFRFLKRSLFHTDGQLMANTQCDYQFNHQNRHHNHHHSHESNSNENGLNRKIHSTESVQDLYNSNMEPLITMVTSARIDSDHDHHSLYERATIDLAQTNGKRSIDYHGSPFYRGHFYSPQYPSTYPKHTRCRYRFKSKPNERIRILFVDISLQRLDQSCISSPDVIKVYDGIDQNADLIGQLCGQSSYNEIYSTTDQLMIEFISKSHQSAKGFKAEFAFVPNNVPSMSADPHLGWWTSPIQSSIINKWYPFNAMFN
ncbi:hypothetical protein RDWZM_009935 [Blomia tropicalis]|uniref:CUB domain-containing protein n=1 Tax=Blomia tropicalis TaxID=40697 RepID=A0A9Q0M0R5_BLOTA|nr:hypothetical protein RDWZM_009935 [Blomia tropicalis]